MAVGGKKPTPKALKLIQGVKNNRINHDEPIPEDGVPVCPSENPAVREVWNYVTDQLKKMRCITMADRDPLLAYCEAVVQHRIASEMLAKDGLLIQGAHTRLVSHPAVRIQRDSATAIRAFGTEFGFTPSARSRVKVKDQQPAQEQGAARLLS